MKLLYGMFVSTEIDSQSEAFGKASTSVLAGHTV